MESPENRPEKNWSFVQIFHVGNVPSGILPPPIGGKVRPCRAEQIPKIHKIPAASPKQTHQGSTAPVSRHETLKNQSWSNRK